MSFQYYNHVRNSSLLGLGLDHDIPSYSYINLVFLSLYISSIVSVGVSISFLIVGHYMKGQFFIVRDRYIDRVCKDKDKDKDSDEEDGDEDEDEDEEDKYYKELNRMSYINKSLDAKGVYNLRFKTVCEQSPDGDDVIMTYNSDSGTFWYYCDNKDSIKFNTLDAIARKFAIEHNCKCVCVNYKEELNKAFHMVDYSAVLKQLKNSWVKPTGAGTGTGTSTSTSTGTSTSTAVNKSIYATFKTYNGSSNNNNNNKHDNNTDTSPGPIKKHLTNRFSYKGKLNEYKPFEEKRCDGNQHTSFANFKKIQSLQKEQQELELEEKQ